MKVNSLDDHEYILFAFEDSFMKLIKYITFMTISTMSANFGKTIDSLNIVSAIDNHGQSILHFIVSGCIGLSHYQCNKLIKYFIDRGCDINLQDSMGKTPVHVAVEEGNVNGLDTLLANGADPNIIDNEGKTAFEHSWQNLAKGTPTSFKIQSYRYLACYINKMQIAGCWISERNKNIYRISLKAYHYYCHSNLEIHLKELHKMSQIHLNNRVTLRNFLEKKDNEVTVLINSDALEKVMNNVDQDFQIFGCLLKLQYAKGITDQKLVNSAHAALKKIIGINLPVLCFENIRLYLDRTDLKNIVNSVEKLYVHYCTSEDFSCICKAIIQSL